MKKTILMALLLSFTMIVAACGGSGGSAESESQKAAKTALESLKTGTYEGMEDVITMTNTMTGTEKAGEFVKAFFSSMEYTIGNETVSGDKSAVSVDLKLADITKVVEDLITKYSDGATPTSVDEVFDEMATSVKSADATKKEYKINLNVEKVDGKWTMSDDNAEFAEIFEDMFNDMSSLSQ